MLHLDIPTPAQLEELRTTRSPACVSIYLPTTPLSIDIEASRIALGNMSKQALAQIEQGDLERRELASLRSRVEGLLDVLVDDHEFWRLQANSLAILLTPDHLWTFRLANTLQPHVEVSDRFHLKPLLRAVAFPQVALVLALSENDVRLVEVFAQGAPVRVDVEGLPSDAASAVSTEGNHIRALSDTFKGAERTKIELAKYSRKVDAALRALIGGADVPLFLAAAEPIAPIFRSVSGLTQLAEETIRGNPDRLTDAQLAEAARPLLDAANERKLEQVRSTFSSRSQNGRAATDLSDVARAAAFGAIDTLMVDIDSPLVGTFDDDGGEVEIADHPSIENYGIVDAIASQALATGAKVIAVRADDLPSSSPVAAILRYPV